MSTLLSLDYLYMDWLLLPPQKALLSKPACIKVNKEAREEPPGKIHEGPLTTIHYQNFMENQVGKCRYRYLLPIYIYCKENVYWKILIGSSFYDMGLNVLCCEFISLTRQQTCVSFSHSLDYHFTLTVASFIDPKV